MWAHYGRDTTGICLAFDEDALVGQLPVAWVGDIEYADGPATIETQVINYAYVTGKPRHAYRLLAVAHRAAYFRKRIDWQYEAERRIVVLPEAVEDRGGILLGKIAPSALRYIIVGPKADPLVRNLCKARAEEWDIPLLELRIGTRTFTPFFSSADSKATIWSGAGFDFVEGVCGACGEPAGLHDSELCQWCSISEEARETGPRRSMLTSMLALGIEKGYPMIFAGIEPRGCSVAAEPGPDSDKSET
jgi:Protein of unknown function (DUF2971)